MTAIGILVLVATVAMFFLSASKQEPPSETPVVTQAEPDVPDSQEAVQPVAAMPVEPEPQPVSRELASANDITTFRPSMPSAEDKAAVLATGNGTPVVAVAETVEELLALEEIQRREVEADLAKPSSETTAAVQPDIASKVAAIAKTWVNMRAGPSDDARVLMVVPGSADIQAETDCGWCAVSYDGREGYIYKTFISYR